MTCVKKSITVCSILSITLALSFWLRLTTSFKAPAISALNNPYNLLAKFKQFKLSSKSFLTSLSLAAPSSCLANSNKQNLNPVKCIDAM
jgi:hypothetical protein